MATKLETINAMPQGTEAELKAKLAALTAFASAEKPAAGTLSVKLSPTGSGTVCVYGLGQYPVSLYPGQWSKLIAFIPQVDKFLTDNHDSLVWEKPAKEKAPAYNAEQQAADYALITGKTKGTEEQIQFAKQRLDARMEKRFGTK